jgi:hypothetical protein
MLGADMPQVLINRRQQSTAGWNIWTTLLDVAGGVLSIAQLVLDALLTHDVGKARIVSHIVSTGSTASQQCRLYHLLMASFALAMRVAGKLGCTRRLLQSAADVVMCWTHSVVPVCWRALRDGSTVKVSKMALKPISVFRTAGD